MRVDVKYSSHHYAIQQENDTIINYLVYNSKTAYLFNESVYENLCEKQLHTTKQHNTNLIHIQIILNAICKTAD